MTGLGCGRKHPTPSSFSPLVILLLPTNYRRERYDQTRTTVPTKDVRRGFFFTKLRKLVKRIKKKAGLTAMIASVPEVEQR